MSRSFFFDTSALIKLYHQEVGTDQVEEIFKQTENSIVISEHVSSLEQEKIWFLSAPIPDFWRSANWKAYRS